MLVSPTRSATRKPDLSAYATNVTRSHGGWLVSLREAETEGPARLDPLVASEPLRRLAFDGEDLIVEFGAGPGRPRRHVITGPLALEPRRKGLELEIRVTGARSTPLLVRLEPPLARP